MGRKNLKYGWLCAFILLFSLHSSSQIKNVGIPFIVNHSRSTYNASNQNWAITQNAMGFMYFGNNDGVLEYDGTSWNVFPAPNLSVARSVLAIGDTIYTGSFEEIGYWVPGQNENLIYHSLNHLIPPDYSNYDEIWKIYESDGKIIFQSFNYIFIYEHGAINIVEPWSSFSLLHEINNHFYVVDTETGLMLLENGALKLVSNDPVFFRNEVNCILPFLDENLLIGTSNEGLFLFDGQNLSPWNGAVNKELLENNLFSATSLSNGNYAFGTIRNGLYISNREGTVIQHLNRFKGLQNNTVLSIYEDRKKNLWLGLDNGIDYIEISSPFTALNYNYNIESTYASKVHNGILYVGTNQGLYAADYSQIRNVKFAEQKFRLIQGTEGQVWTLDVIDNRLFCGHNFGCFLVEGFSAQQISDIRGYWSFSRLSDNIIIAGTYTGMVKLQRTSAGWAFLEEVAGFKESSRSKYLDPQNNIWISHGYKGLFRIKFNNTFDTVLHAQLFRARMGLPDLLPYNIQLIDNEIVVTTHTGIFKYDNQSNEFYMPDDLNKLFENKGFIDKIHQDNNGNLWYFTIENMGVMRFLEDGTYRDITTPFSGINENLLPSFQNIHIADANNVFIGSQLGLIHYEPSIIKDYSSAEDVFIKQSSFYGKQESMSMHFVGSHEPNAQENTPQIPFSLNSVLFRFTSPAYEDPEKVRFSFRLKGFEENWSEWDRNNFKEYTNLREGEYIFQVKAINAFDTESPVRYFHFTISPPLLRSPLAYGIYTALILLIIAGNIYFIRKRMLRIRQKEKLRHEKRLARRELDFRKKTELSEKEIIHLRNESLKNEMKFKNKELANTTLHLIQKNRTLTSLKNELTKLIKNAPSGSNEGYVANHLIKKINKDLRNEKQWELFNNYFDEVHQDFINRLKEKYSNLTPKELRLCAYLRMNISTKEIAPLMNISVRGVEISRYRLRKKLNLAHDANLTEFILTF